MEVIARLEQAERKAPRALALGAFDGLHRGHMAVIGAAAAAMPGAAGVFTFAESPGGSPALLTPRDKLALLEEAGIGWVCAPRFEDLRVMGAEDFFFRVLVERCGAAALFCGEDFRFGRGAAGDVGFLQRLCSQAHVALTVVPPVTQDGEKISSTRIRAAVAAGDIPLANELLGRPFGYTLEVIHGNHIGAGLGTPTINQAMPAHFLLPPFGVYASRVEMGEAAYYGVTNIGVKPTVGSDRVLSETWMPDYAGDLYGKEVRVLLLAFLRPERRFASLHELREQIGRDAARAQALVDL